MIRGIAAAALLASLAPAVVRAGEAPPEPSGYRMAEYRAPTPLTVNGRAALTTREAEALWRAHAAVFVDTLPRAPRPAGLPEGTIFRPKPREDIPGSVWLADTGYGALAEPMAAYFATGLQRATGGDPGRTLVFYCLAECWMSWNAARRAEALGYRAVAWYRDGTDGWAASGLPLEVREPEKRPGE